MGKLLLNVMRIILVAVVSRAREVSSTFSYSGTKFAFSFLAHTATSTHAPCAIDIMCAENVDTIVHITVGSVNFSTVVLLHPGTIEHVELNLHNSELYDRPNATVVINASAPIGVIAFIRFVRPSAVFQAIPESYAGTVHVIASHENRNTQFTITSLADLNTISINQSNSGTVNCDAIIPRPNVLVTISGIAKHESIFCQGSNMDFTGTSIESSKPVSVVAGGNRVKIYEGRNARRGYIMEQMPPVQGWGTHYAVAPFAKLNESNYMLRLISAPGQSATVRISGLDRIFPPIEVNGVKDFPDPPSIEEVIDEVIEINSTHPIFIMQYMIGAPVGIRSDPSMVVIPPLIQNQQNVLVDIFSADTNENIINVLIDCSFAEGLLINGLEIPQERVISIFNGTNYCALSVELDPGLHCVSHVSEDAFFHVILYSWKILKDQNAYAMHAGVSVPPDYPTCLPPMVTTQTMHTATETAEEVYQIEELYAALEEEDPCGNTTESNGPADVAWDIEQVTQSFTADMLDRGESSFYADLGQLVVDIQQVNFTATAVSIPSKGNATHVKTRAMLDTVLLSDLQVQAVISILYRSLGSAIDECSTAQNDTGNTNEADSETIVASEILSISLFPPVASSRKLSPPVEITFMISTDMPPRFDNATALCSFWDYNTGGWSQEGCETEVSVGSQVRCTCDHLTNFAVLMQINNYELPQRHMLAVNVLTPIGCALSVVGAILTIVTFAFLRLRSDRVLIHINLALAVGIGQVVFMCLETPVTMQFECTIKAAFLYYFFMAAFCWMLVEGVNLYLQAVVVFNKPGSRMRVYLVIGWVCPIVPLAATLAFYKGVIGDDITRIAEPICFVRWQDDSIWFFVVPVLTIIALNVYFVFRVVCEIVKLAGGPTMVNNRVTQAKQGVRACVILLPVMGLTWVFGVLWRNESTLVFMYLFIICNSLQGLFLFLFHCVLNSEVRHAFRRKKEKWMMLSFSRRSTFHLNIFRSDDSKKRNQNGDSNTTRNGSDKLQTNQI